MGSNLATLLPRASRHALRYLHRLQGVPSTPAVLSFLVTARCQLRCQHCFYHHASDDPATADELTFDEYRQLSGSLDDFAVGLFCGGEPFLRADLAEIVHLFREQNDLLVALCSTNGQASAAVIEQSEQILTRHPNRPFVLSVSLDGFEEQHDASRGPNTYRRALRTWRACQALGRHHPNLVLMVTTVVSRLNQAIAPRFVRWAWSELQPDNVAVLLVRQQPRAGPKLKEVAPERYRAAQAAALQPLTRTRLWWLDHPELLYLTTTAQGVARTLTTGQRSFRCHAGRHGAVVDPCGRLHACEALAEHRETGTMGGLRNVGMDFGTAWRSGEATAARRWVGRHEICASCTHETMGYLPSLPFSGNRLRLDPRKLTA
ncbi:MAG: radical SAM protein [Deltaproteobacteria bacterium]|nr:radical SAM protein [Deltaproteobacteria bacterium]